MPRYAIFEVSLSKEAEDVVEVGFATADGTATAVSGAYTATSGTLTFAVGEQTKEIAVPIRDAIDDEDNPEGTFTLTLSAPNGGTLGSKVSGTAEIPGTQDLLPLIPYIERFRVIHDALYDPANKYFGPETAGAAPGRALATLPKHVAGVDSMILNEAPDYSGETVSETVSFWVGLEAWNGWVTEQETGVADWAPYNNVWDMIDTYYVPPLEAASMVVYNVDRPADYIPNANSPSLYPGVTQLSAPVGVDPLWEDLKAQYGSDRMHLMHWILDVEGAYGFHNFDGSTRNVYINTYQRGLQESSFETVTQGTWNDWNNGGGPYGFEPIFTQGLPLYPMAPFEYGRKWSYTCAPDAEVRAVQWAFEAKKIATAQGLQAQIASSQQQAIMMADYTRYALFDKYFRKIGKNDQGTEWPVAPLEVDAEGDDVYSSCHFLINWYVSWGGEIVPEDDPDPERDPYYNFLVSCSECHQGYQGVDMAYACATGGGGMEPSTTGAGDLWLGSLYRQIEMIRWLQSPEGPIAGGVTNSMFDQYINLTDGRQNAQFYGMDYVYSPVWHDPVSNNWVGFQGWGQGRTANLFLEVSDKNTTLANQIRPNLEIILDRLVAWFLPLVSFERVSFSLPSTISWVSDVQVPGETVTTANLEGVYEYLPSLDWDGTGDYGAFWNASSVPNPNLHCSVLSMGEDLGVAASMAYLLLCYAKAKENMGKWNSVIPNTVGLTAKDAYHTARGLLDRSWRRFDGVGVAVDESRGDYNRMADEVYVPTIFSGTMPNGDPVVSGATFISIRSFLMDDPKWPECLAYINGTGPAPVFRYHRFWAQCEFAISCAAMAKHFGDYIETDTEYDYE